MTTPTDPTTLRTALEALVSTAWMSDEDGSCVLCGYGFDPEDHTLTDCPVNLARAALATPAPAADEARCGFMWSVDGRACGRPEDDERHTEDAFLFHPFQPAPTPAPPTPPATEPVAALVERLLDRLYPVTPNGRTGFAWKEYDATKAELLALLVAARAEVDVERLARALEKVQPPDPEDGEHHNAEFARILAAAYREVEP